VRTLDTNPIGRFWIWFRDNVRLLELRPTDPDLCYQLGERIDSIDPRLEWEIGPAKCGTGWQLVVSPGRDPEMMTLARKVVLEAPQLSNWTFESLRPPKKWGDELHIAQRNGELALVNVSQWAFVILQYPDGVLEILISCEGNVPPPEVDRTVAGEIVVESILGESPFVHCELRVSVVEQVEQRLQGKERPLNQLREVWSKAGGKGESSRDDYMASRASILTHYSGCFGGRFTECEPPPSEHSAFAEPFAVAEFVPTETSPYWKYCTIGAGAEGRKRPDRLEFHLLSPVQDSRHVELLAAIAHYHLSGGDLDEGHIVNFGRPWLPGSLCSYGLISKPYHYGPDLERSADPVLKEVRFLWLIPITAEEREYANAFGLEALEALFEENSLRFWAPDRESLDT